MTLALSNSLRPLKYATDINSDCTKYTLFKLVDFISKVAVDRVSCYFLTGKKAIQCPITVRSSRSIMYGLNFKLWSCM